MAFSRMVVFYVLINHRYRDIFTDIFKAPLELLLFQNWKNTSKLPKIPFSEDINLHVTQNQSRNKKTI